ncbi:MAG: SH3 domain-containing protein [Symploca sp. SIO1C4]|uniref:SH3 domain-containing protein n=1 Tax=Symploca sp. SIO1C4 TaxID=2607765 RepID=A0A6B3ND91_9CYAN|nr:SH3 domain-containing protein [Symploca sp. SIO1C4]
MKNNICCFWKKLLFFASVFSFPLIAVSAGATTPIAQEDFNTAATTKVDIYQETQPTFAPIQDNWQLAQGIVGQCRASNRTIDVFSEASVVSTTVRTLGTNAQVTLADEGDKGWIQISAPISGYVIARYLKACGDSAQPPKPPSGKLCRKVIYRGSGGLAVRSPNLNSSKVGAIPYNTTVTLWEPPDFRTISGRGWTRITAPISGWVTTGRPQGNFGPRFSCP